MDGYEEITKILESLVQDNETLKHDNDELQQLLSHSREDFASLQEEYEEYKANPVISRSGGWCCANFCSPHVSERAY